VNEDIEELLRAELAGRADSAQVSSGEGLAEAAIAGAGRIRRRRRIGAAAGGIGLVVFGAAAAVWLPGGGDVFDDSPSVATSAEEARSELAIEFVVERGGSYGVVSAENEYIPLSVQDRPQSVERLRESYVVSASEQVEVTSLDGSSSTEYGIPAGFFSTLVRSDAEGFAVQYYNVPAERQTYELFPADPEATASPAVLELSDELNLEDWNEDTLVFSTDLISVTGGESLPHYFNDQHDWGLDTAADAGYESVAVVDLFQPSYVCVSDLVPGAPAPESEECGYLQDEEIETLLAEASGDGSAPGFVEEVAGSFFGEVLDDEVRGSPSTEAQLFEAENLFIDPLGRWRIGFSEQDETWALLDTTGDEPFLSDLHPPEGALLPVVSYN
jgi:hypothetical protein